MTHNCNSSFDFKAEYGRLTYDIQFWDIPLIKLYVKEESLTAHNYVSLFHLRLPWLSQQFPSLVDYTVNEQTDICLNIGKW